MNTYEVKIYRDGKHVDTQIVKAEREGLAKTTAMAQTKIVFRGALVSYEIKKLDEEAR